MSKEAMNLALAFVKDIQRGKYEGDAEEVITALQSAMTEQPAPVQGWKLVPVEPTREIEDAIAKARTLKASEIWGDAIAAAPQPAQQEPVAWVLLRQDEDGFEPIQFYGGKQKPEGDFKDRFTLRPVCFADATPPAQRKPLTREVIERDFYGRIDFVRLIEAAHGIKENT